MKTILAAAVLFLTLAVTAFNVTTPVVPDAKQVKKTVGAIKAGAIVYAAKCQTCHENTEIDMSVKTYTQMMPLLASMVDMEKLSRKDIDNVAAYVYSVSKK